MKKELLIKTGIGALVLLVMVIGATFAFFLTDYSATSATNVSVGATTPKKPGTIVLQGQTKTISMTLTSTQMSETNKGKTFYAPKTGTTAIANTEQKIPIATITSTNNDGIKYKCYYAFSLDGTSSGDDSTLFSSLTDDDVAIKFSSDSEVIFHPYFGCTNNICPYNDISSLPEYIAEFTFTGNKTITLFADMYIKNSNANQAYLSNATFNIYVRDSRLAGRISSLPTSTSEDPFYCTIVA